MDKPSASVGLDTGVGRMGAKEVLDAYFLETRGKLIEVAANLDRIDRAAGRGGVAGDRRMRFIGEALKILGSEAPNRAELVLRLWSLDVEGAV